MPYRKIAGYTKQGKVWVAPEIPKKMQPRIRSHMNEFQRCREKDVPRTEALRRANKKEVQGMTKKEAQLYNLKLARITKNLPVRQSYSPIRKR